LNGSASVIVDGLASLVELAKDTPGNLVVATWDHSAVCRIEARDLKPTDKFKWASCVQPEFSVQPTVSCERASQDQDRPCMPFSFWNPL
jgi:hypothetical protein